MARGYGDIGMFLPSEAQYATPGGYETLLQSEATKRAQYLAQMDQFYLELEESQRQFDETMDFQVATRDLGLELSYKQLEQQKDLSLEEIALRRELGETEASLKSRELDITQSYQNKQYGLAKDQLELSKRQYEEGPTADEKWDWLTDYLEPETSGSLSFYDAGGAISEEEYRRRRREELYGN